MTGEYDYGWLGDKRLDLSPGSPHSAVIVKELRKYVELSDNALYPNMGKYREMDRILTAHMPEDAYDRAVKGKDPRKQLTFVVPTTFAMKEMFQTVFTDTFCRGEAIHLYRGFGGPESRVMGALYERCAARQSAYFRERLFLDSAFGDAVTYSRARAVVRWRKHQRKDLVNEELSDLYAFALRKMGHNAAAKQVLSTIGMVTQFEGNEIKPISIYNQIIDPRCGVNNALDAEFGGWRWPSDVKQILRWEGDPEERFFNGRHLTERNNERTPDWWGKQPDARGGDGRSSDDINSDENNTDSLQLVTVCVDFIPHKWFGEGFPDEPVKWQFTVAPGDVIVQAHELDHWHGMFPWADCAPNDGHLAVPTSHLMTTYAFQQFGSWLMKSRAHAVLTLLNGKLIVNNDKVNIQDFQRTDIGGIVRLKASAYGDEDISKLVHQLTFDDPTLNHIDDFNAMDQIARNGNGINDAVMGQIRSSSDRVTATEVNNAKSQSLNRLARLALVIDEQFMRPLGMQIAHNTRQWMSEDVFVPLVGERYEAELRRQYGVERGHGEVRVGPGALNAMFEVESRTALRPGVDDVSAMTELLKPIMALEGIPQQIASDYRVSDIFANLIQKLGLENISDFRRLNIEVMPDEQYLQQVQQGNLVGGASPIPATPFMGVQ